MADALQNFAAVRQAFSEALSPINNFVREQSQRRYAQQVMEQQTEVARTNREEENKVALTNRLAELGISVPEGAKLSEVQKLAAGVPDVLGVRAADEIVSIDKQIDGTLKKLGDRALAAPLQSKRAAAVKFLNDPEVISALIKDGKNSEEITALRDKLMSAPDDASAEKLVNTTINDITAKWFWRTDKEKRADLTSRFITQLHGGVEGLNQSPDVIAAVTDLQTLIHQRGQRYGNLNSAGFERLRSVRGSGVPDPVIASAATSGRLTPDAPEFKNLMTAVGNPAAPSGAPIGPIDTAGLPQTLADPVAAQDFTLRRQQAMQAIFGAQERVETLAQQLRATEDDIRRVAAPRPEQNIVTDLDTGMSFDIGGQGADSQRANIAGALARRQSLQQQLQAAQAERQALAEQTMAMRRQFEASRPQVAAPQPFALPSVP